MEKVKEASDKAIRNIKIADHMLTQTYPHVRDPKLLLVVLENVFLSLTNSMAALLYYERHFKRIPPFQNTFDSKFNMFKFNVANKYEIKRDYISMISGIKNILVAHKKSPMEFSRKESFVICADNYDMKALSVEQMKGYISKTKSFLEEVNGVISKDERSA